MAKNKKRPVPGDEKKRAEMTPASKWTQNEALEDLFSGEEQPETTEAAVSEEKDMEKEAMCALLRRLMDDMGAGSLTALADMIDKAEMQKLVRTYGFDETSAKMFLSQQEKVRALREAEAKAAREAAYAEMKANPLYDDVEGRKSAIEAFIFRTGTSPREAYNALFAEERYRRLREKLEAEKSAAEKKSKHIPALAGGDAGDKAGHFQLSDAEKWAAARAGMTPAEYAKYKFSY
ncbi:MAG: hypothetical protein E7390_08790 [Ruminococcaceae bacterium]|nr:hypothetical protein [Oscillospiraceae bacterium]